MDVAFQSFPHGASDKTVEDVPGPDSLVVIRHLESWSITLGDPDRQVDHVGRDTLTLTATPAAGGSPDARDGTFIVEGRQVHATLSSGDPMVLTFVNDGYESTSFGLPMRFVKQ
jgi:hypothetical protein